MNINEHLDSINIGYKFYEVDQLLQKATARVTWWGSRVVTVKGYTGSISLDDLSSRINAAAEGRFNNRYLNQYYFSEGERMNGIQIYEKLNEFYRDINIKTKKAHWFTKLMIIVKKWLSPNKRILKDISYKEKYFLSFKEADFYALFGKDSNPSGNKKQLQHPAIDFIRDNMIVAKKQSLLDVILAPLPLKPCKAIYGGNPPSPSPLPLPPLPPKTGQNPLPPFLAPLPLTSKKAVQSNVPPLLVPPPLLPQKACAPTPIDLINIKLDEILDGINLNFNKENTRSSFTTNNPLIALTKPQKDYLQSQIEKVYKKGEWDIRITTFLSMLTITIAKAKLKKTDAEEIADVDNKFAEILDAVEKNMMVRTSVVCLEFLIDPCPVGAGLEHLRKKLENTYKKEVWKINITALGDDLLSPTTFLEVSKI